MEGKGPHKPAFISAVYTVQPSYQRTVDHIINVIFQVKATYGNEVIFFLLFNRPGVARAVL